MGLFEDLHGFSAADTFARFLQDSAKRVYGAPVRHFLEFLTKNLDQVQTILRGCRKAFLEKYVPKDASGEVSRAAGRFSLAAAAGELAIEAGILPWPEDTAASTAVDLFMQWLAGGDSRNHRYGSRNPTSPAISRAAWIRPFRAGKRKPAYPRPGWVLPSDQQRQRVLDYAGDIQERSLSWLRFRGCCPRSGFSRFPCQWR